jgi:hypothetical protein
MTKPLNSMVMRELAVPEKGAITYSFSGAIIEGKAAPAGFAVQVSAGGTRAFTLSYRQHGKQKRETIGRWPTWTCTKAAQRARELRQAVDRGETIGKAQTAASGLATGQEGAGEGATAGPLMGDVLDAFLKGHVAKLKAGTATEATRIVEKDLRPQLGSMAIGSIGTPQINVMREAIRARAKGMKRAGAVTEERTLSVLRKCFDWFKSDSTDAYSATFVNPMPPGWGRAPKKERSKRRGSRILCKGKGQDSDADLVTLWKALENPEEGQRGTRNGSGERLAKRYPAFIRMCLWTAARRSEVSGMHERELSISMIDGQEQWLWKIPAERMKGGIEHIVPLSRQAIAELKALKVKPGGRRHLFTEEGKAPFSDYSGNMTALRKRIAAIRKKAKKPAMVSFGPHDLRRTSRTLMRRLGVPHDIGELAIAHVEEELIATYSLHEELPAIREAFQKLGDEIERIIDDW